MKSLFSSAALVLGLASGCSEAPPELRTTEATEPSAPQIANVRSGTNFQALAVGAPATGCSDVDSETSQGEVLLEAVAVNTESYGTLLTYVRRRASDITPGEGRTSTTNGIEHAMFIGEKGCHHSFEITQGDAPQQIAVWAYQDGKKDADHLYRYIVKPDGVYMEGWLSCRFPDGEYHGLVLNDSTELLKKASSSQRPSRK